MCSGSVSGQFKCIRCITWWLVGPLTSTSCLACFCSVAIFTFVAMKDAELMVGWRCRGLGATAAVRVVALYAPLPGHASTLRAAAVAMRDSEPSVPLRPGTTPFYCTCFACVTTPCRVHHQCNLVMNLFDFIYMPFNFILLLMSGNECLAMIRINHTHEPQEVARNESTTPCYTIVHKPKHVQIQ